MKSGQLILWNTSLNSEKEFQREMVDEISDYLDGERKFELYAEDPKPTRRRWTKSGLPRDFIPEIRFFNEHSMADLWPEIKDSVANGRTVFLLSDGGTPGLCDPGRDLIYACQSEKLKVRLKGQSNSIIQAVTLSGLHHDHFIFHGFLPKMGDERMAFYRSLLGVQSKTCHVMMDTPYRLKKFLEEGTSLFSKHRHELFLALDIETDNEEHYLGDFSQAKKIYGAQKRLFVAVVKIKIN